MSGGTPAATRYFFGKQLSYSSAYRSRKLYGTPGLLEGNRFVIPRITCGDSIISETFLVGWANSRRKVRRQKHQKPADVMGPGEIDQ